MLEFSVAKKFLTFLKTYLFSSLTENTYRQTIFVFNTIEFLRKKGFDGLDICWEFPRGQEDKDKYSKLIKVYNHSANNKTNLKLFKN